MLSRYALASLLCTSIAATAGAQETGGNTRQGFGISFGLGAGSAAVSCEDCSSERDNGLSGYLRIGGYARPSLFVGGETNGWVRNDQGVDQQIGILSAVVQWYPQSATGFYLKGGGGFARVTANDGFDEVASSGIALTGGAGYDWRLTRNFSLTPYANYVRSVGAEAEVNGMGTGYKLNV